MHAPIYRWRHKMPSTAWKVSYVSIACTSIFGLPSLVSGFLFVPIWGMRTIRFGDNARRWATYRKSSALPRLPLREQLRLGSFELHVTGACLRYKAHPPNKGSKFKVWMTILESGGNVWVWLVGVVSRRRVWLVGVGEIYGCGYWVWF